MIHLGVIGYGYWGPNLVRHFTDNPDSTVVHVAERDPDRLALALARHPTIRVSTDWREMLADARVDAIVIATPLSTHFELARMILASGRHVLIEKPMTRTIEEAEILGELAAAHDVVLMVGHTLLYSGAVRTMREIVQRGELGSLCYFDSVRTNLGPFRADASAMWDLAAHDVSIMNFVLGVKPEAVSALGTGLLADGIEDVCHLTATYAGSRCMAHSHSSWLAPTKVRQVILAGSRKMLTFDDLETSEKIRVFDRGIDIDDARDGSEPAVSYRRGGMHAPTVDTAEPLQAECAHFLDCIHTGRTPLTDAVQGLDVVRVLVAAQDSMRRHGICVPVPYAR